MSELDEQIKNRREKRARLAALGIDAYPHRFDYDLEPSQVQSRYGDRSAEELEQAGLHLRVPGRVRALRKQGKTWFLDLNDGLARLQVLVRRDDMPERARAALELLDLGDQLGVSGKLQRTRAGELTLFAEDLVLLAKALRPMPEKWHGLADVETRYRQRYLDLIANPESRRVFETRAVIVRGIRDFLDRRGFVEVETPMMHLLPTGAAARPFTTHHNALDLKLYMRIAPELFLKRLTVGGMHRVYEINRNFRNEGISTQHNPEFTMLEFYWAYVDFQALMTLTEEMFVELATKIHGAPLLAWQGASLDLSPPWRRLSIREAIVEFAGVPAERLEGADTVAAELRSRQIEVPAGGTYGHLLMALFEATAEEHLVQPTFITGHPVEVSPLSKQNAEDPRFTDRFELYLGGMEVANGFSELNDPDVQAQRFREQVEARGRGDQEAHPYDEDYVLALEQGMPPAGGEGIGIDRMVMLFTNSSSIRDVILFPLMRPLADSAG